MKKIAKVVGTTKYAKVFERNRDLGSDENEGSLRALEAGGMYSINIWPDDVAEFEVELESKGANMSPMGHPLIRTSDEGPYSVFRRGHNCPKNDKGEDIKEFGGPPKVVDVDGNPWDPDVNIGNGSKCEVAFDVWGKGWTKLRGVRVLELVEWIEDDVDPALAWAI